MRNPTVTVKIVNWRRAVRWTALLLAACMILPSLGCSYFQTSTSANLAPFAEQTLAMAGRVEHSLGQGRLVYARHLAQGPETQAPVAHHAAHRDAERTLQARQIE